MRDPILVINAGSSSIKFSVFETQPDRSLTAGAHGEVEGIGTAPHLKVAGADGTKLADEKVAGEDHKAAIDAIHNWFAFHVGSEASFDGVGHRIVHGGRDYDAPVRIDDKVIAALEALVPLAPLHQPHHLAAIRAISEAAPDLPQIACFDTAFHHAQDPIARAYGLPRHLSEAGVERYGFHGISYEYIVSSLPRVAPELVHAKLVVAHLGNGASLCAIESGRSIATTMGFTALDGLVMGTRAGSLDPGVVLYLMQHEKLDAAAIEDLLYRRSGLLGVSGVSSDMRALLASDVPEAREAVDLFVYRVARELGSLAAAMGGLDAIIFTGGIGEHAAPVRAGICHAAAWFGLELDEHANKDGGPVISRAESRVTALVVPTDENLMIARHTRRLLDRG